MTKYLKLNIQLFGVSASNDKTLTATSGNKGKLTASFTENSTNNTNNTSNVTCSATMKMTSGSFASYNTTKLEIWWYDDKTNTETKLKEEAVTSLAKGASKTITYTTDVEHKADGTLNGYALAKWVHSGSGQYAPQSGNVQTVTTQLTAIPRGTDVPTIVATIGDTTTITLNPKNNTYTHRLRYDFGSLTNQTIASNVSTSYTWSVPTTFYGQLNTTQTSKTGTFYVDTYSGNSLVQTKSATFTAVVDATLGQPTITVTSVLDVNQTSINATGDNTKFVQDISTARVTYSITSPSSANISAVTINNKSVSTSATTYDITNINTKTITISATDSRGYSNSYTYTIADAKWIPYVKPSITGTFTRDTTITDRLHFTWESSVYKQYTHTEDYRFREKNGSWSSWTSLTASSTTTTGEYLKSTGTFDKDSINPEKTYDFQFRVKDPIYTSGRTTTVTVLQEQPVCWWNEEDFTMNNNFIYTTASQASTENIKKNFAELGDVMEVVKYFKIYSYNLKKEKDGSRKHYGFVIPTSENSKFEVPEQVVSKNGKGIDIYSMCSILWRAVQELEEEIEELKKR